MGAVVWIMALRLRPGLSVVQDRLKNTPVAAHEKSGGGIVAQQHIVNGAVEPSRVFRFLAQVEGQGHVGF